jgi:hypothetical protein
MTDPERLLARAGSLEARLLGAALDEPPPPDLLARTLVVAAKAAGGGILGAIGIGAAKAAGGGMLGAIGIGALAGMLAVGAFELAASAPPTSSRHPLL